MIVVFICVSESQIPNYWCYQCSTIYSFIASIFQLTYIEIVIVTGFRHNFKILRCAILVSSLEVFVWSHWLEKYLAEGNSIDEADKIVTKLFDDGLQKAIRKRYFSSVDEDSRKKHEIWIKLQNVRNIRKNVIHPHTKEPSPEATRQVLLDVPIITSWISEQRFP